MMNLGGGLLKKWQKGHAYRQEKRVKEMTDLKIDWVVSFETETFGALVANRGLDV